jgi:endonuclease VIII-like 1
MPEAAEVRIMSEYVSQLSKDKKFIKLYHVQKGNQPFDANFDDYYLDCDFYGKQIILFLKGTTDIKISIFMGMSGNWTLVPTETWNETKYTRLRLDREDGMSLLLYGGYLGPKYKIGGFNTKRGFDIIKDFDKFKDNILNNLGNKIFEKSICEVLLDQRYFDGVGAYLCSEILGRLDYDPFLEFNNLNTHQLDDLFNMTHRCIKEAYEFGGGELKDWQNPYGSSKLDDWMEFYGNKRICYKQPFGKRNIWIQKKYKK